MELKETIKKRRSIRKFKDIDIFKEIVEDLESIYAISVGYPDESPK